jgi:PAS domain S-box-containing protein
MNHMLPPVVLMIDHDTKSAHIRGYVLELSGYRVQYAQQPEAAFPMLLERPDLLLYNLSGEGNMQAFRELRRRADKIPAVALVDSPAASQPPEVADRFVVKVDGPRALLKNLDSLIRYKHHPHPELEGDRVVLVDHDRRYIEATRKACELIGYEPAELIGKRIDDVSLPDSDIVQQRFKEYVQSGRQEGVFVLKHKDGHQVPIQYRALVLPDGCMAAEWEPLDSATHSSAL